jgi:lysozyme family protein
MAAGNFNACLTETLKWEGGYSNHPSDPGGATMKGVIQTVYDGYRDGKGLARQPVRNIADSEVREIYQRNYWTKVNGDMQPFGVDLAVFDYGVNSGPGRAVPALAKAQRNTIEGTIKALCASRTAFVKGLRIFATFGTGWMRRISGIEARAVRMHFEATGLTPAQTKERLSNSGAMANRTAKQQGGGAAVGGGGAAGATDYSSVPGTIVAIAIFALAAFLIYRMVINRKRAAAYQEQASLVVVAGTP